MLRLLLHKNWFLALRPVITALGCRMVGYILAFMVRIASPACLILLIEKNSFVHIRNSLLSYIFMEFHCFQKPATVIFKQFLFSCLLIYLNRMNTNKCTRYRNMIPVNNNTKPKNKTKKSTSLSPTYPQQKCKQDVQEC